MTELFKIKILYLLLLSELFKEVVLADILLAETHLMSHVLKFFGIFIHFFFFLINKANEVFIKFFIFLFLSFLLSHLLHIGIF